MPRVVITGIGVIAPNATGKTDFLGALREGKSGIGPVTLFDTDGLPVRIAGEIDSSSLKQTVHSGWPEIPRSVWLTLSAIQMAIDDAGIDLNRVDPNRAGIVLGSATNKYALQEEEFGASFSDYTTYTTGYTLRPEDFFLPGKAAQYYGIRGPIMNIDMACSSGNQAVQCARDLIRTGRAELVLAGGVDLPVNLMVFTAFCQIRALSKRNEDPERASRPFDRNRDGLILSEGAGILVLESLEHARKRKARIYAETMGAGLTSDGYHMLIPEKSGLQMVRAMQLALADARLSPGNVDYINAHGTSTKLNDMIESHAIARLFDTRVPVSSTKSMIGHTLGAAGAIEIITCLLAMRYSFLPPTLNLDERDPECADLDYVPHATRDQKVSICMSNSFAFGGSNSSLILKQFE